MPTRVIKIVLSQETKVSQTSLIAQEDVESGSFPTESPELSVGLSLSDSTRLGPYSLLLKDAFEETQSQQTLQLNESTPNVDIVAIERSLTPEEQQQGLRQQLVTREKIALIVDADNPFQGTLTLQQVAGIFRGEITNWKQVGGEDRPIVLINRSAQNSTRQALESYGLFEGTTFDTSAVDAEQDTTADVLETLEENGLGYAPASETIEQFNTRVLTIDNVGVDDGRYPFSMPLNYVYAGQPKPAVQDFLDFLQTPDAQSAIDFAQSQPADPTRVLQEPDLSALKAQSSKLNQSGQSKSSGSSESGKPETNDSATEAANTKPTSPSPTEAIPAKPLESPASDTSPVPNLGIQPSSSPLSWVPLLLVFLGMGVLGWLAYVRVTLEKKRKNAPRPAPDYAARVHAQGSNRDKDEMRALTQSRLQSERATPDLSLGDKTLAGFETNQPPDGRGNWVESERDPEHQSNLDQISKDAESSDGWEEDLTVLQGAASVNIDEESGTELDTVQGDDSLGDIDTEDLTILQSTVSAAPTSSVSAHDPEQYPYDDEDMTVLQGVFEPEETQPHADDLADMTVLQNSTSSKEPHRDPITGQWIEDLEQSPPTGHEADRAAEIEASETPVFESDHDLPKQKRDQISKNWDEISDPWE